MVEPRLRFVQCLSRQRLHRIAYWEWGEPANRNVLVCVHGLTRQGRDFDALARAMCSRYRVVCPDVVGRGQSDWLQDPLQYENGTYVSDLITLLARLDGDAVDWVGTSMGGLIGIRVAALPGSPIRALVINDVGPTLDPPGLARIGSYVGASVRFASEEEGIEYLAAVAKSFGPHTAEQWRALNQPMLKRAEDAVSFVLHYDPRIAIPFRAMTPEAVEAAEAAMWQRYDAIRARTLVIRGAESDLLSAHTAEQMSRRGPRATLCELPGVGHAPTLIADDQIGIIREFLS